MKSRSALIWSCCISDSFVLVLLSLAVKDYFVSFFFFFLVTLSPSLLFPVNMYECHRFTPPSQPSGFPRLFIPPTLLCHASSSALGYLSPPPPLATLLQGVVMPFLCQPLTETLLLLLPLPATVGDSDPTDLLIMS